jgi:hypothetical protein
MPSEQSASPDQPLKRELPSAVAVSVTCCPCAKGTAHASPHEMPEGELVTVPSPAPVFVIVSVGPVENVAVHARSALIVTVAVVELPLHAPVHRRQTRSWLTTR